MSVGRRLFFLTATVAVAACGSSDTSGPVVVAAAKATQYLITISAAAAAPGGTVTVTAQLATSSGTPVDTAGVFVAWTSSGGAGSTRGSLAAPASATNASGVATIVFTTSTAAGTVHTVTATDIEGNTGTSGSILTTGRQLASIVGGGYHTCGLDAAGIAYCWGRNANGQLGDGTTTNRLAPIAVSGGLTFLSLTAGDFHTCGVATGGVTYCWGMNAHGQLGDGTKIDRSAPTAVSAGGRTFQTISAALNHSCAVTSAGAAFCWGQNSLVGQLGDGTLVDKLTPAAVIGGHAFLSVVAANTSTCGLATGGAVYCWGSNVNGQLGDGSTNNHSSPTAVIGGGLVFQSISMGTSACALTNVGGAYCWGANEGLLGDGTPLDRPSPVPVTGGLLYQNLSTGGSSTCGVKLGGALYCWGSNALGQVGDGGTLSDRLAPAAVNPALLFQSVSPGGLHVCGLLVSGAVLCWGDNESGELGDGTTTNRHSPTVVLP